MSSGKYSHAPAREAVFWSDKMNKYLIDSLLHQDAMGNRSDEGRFFSVAYDNIITGIGDRFGVAIDRNNIKNRLKYIKETFNECKNILGEDSRIKWSTVSKRFNADPHVWRELIKAPDEVVIKQNISEELDLSELCRTETGIIAIPVCANTSGTQKLRIPEPEPEPVVSDPAGPCKARNNLCSLEREGFIESSPAQACDICCTEPGFCRECCCILCRRTIDNSFGGYSFIKCEAVVEENYICGHVAHLDCALRCYMAGTVGGTIGLDVQYYCRRCDNKTNLMLTCGVDLVEVWSTEGDEGRATSLAGENSSLANGVTVLGAQQVPEEVVLPGHPDLIDPLADNKLETSAENLPMYITGDHNAMSAKLEDDIDLALQELKKSQEEEYRLAEQKLYSQKDYILSVYRQLESERAELANPSPLSHTSNYGAILSNVLNRVDQVKREEEKLKTMLKVAGGFGKTPKSITQELFGLSASN
ncbi:hypothetical protein PR202_ga13452 [Eleusine coracana subsp. coracana]|uniref:Oberon PHD finger domain-containing protein n=1 Tax=Eleusine coracana subsp. coracana TaxID=191504 RepID=A0AAV5CEQ6_ELECO|nr:hypothetical protein PR202_ga13452 [Eleusine coracana subsp. coracana]